MRLTYLTRYTRTWPVLGLAIFAAASSASALTCKTFTGTTPQAALAYLQQDRSTLEPACIDQAIGIVKVAHYVPAIAILFTYLDFKKPTDIPGLPPIAHPAPTSGRYPAADALGVFGASIIPDLQNMIQNENAVKITRINAAAIYFFGSPTASTVKFIYAAGERAADQDTGGDLRSMAKNMVRYLPKDEQEDCKRSFASQ